MSFNELLADLLMLAHACFSVFVLYGLVFIFAGLIVNWRWTRNAWFLNVHLGLTVLLLARIWLSQPCPFSLAEDSLRRQITAPCPLGNPFHDILHQLAFRGDDPHGFARSTTIFGVIALLAHVASRLRWSKQAKV
jgi:hypothetical protein